MSVLPTSAETSIDLNGIFSAIDFDGVQSIVVAVSGGSDSLALLYLLLEYRASRDSFPEILAVTIDHGLRRESRDEADYVGELCRQANINHRILQWQGEKPGTAVSAKAREARYKLLCDAARSVGAGMIFTGHTLDDQAETFIMRSARSKSGGSERGQAGMAPASLLERQVWLMRPLLNMCREELRSYLRRLGIAWRDDPSNESSKYERVRVRKTIRENDLTPFCREIGERASDRVRINAEVAETLPGCVTITRGIVAEIDHRRWGLLKPEIQQLAVGVLLAVMGGQSFLPAATACKRALKFIEETTWHRKLSLGRCIIEMRSGKILIYREMRSIPAVDVEPGVSVVWDGRYRVANGSRQPLVIEACGARRLGQWKDRLKDVYGPSALSSPVILINGADCLPVFDDHGKLPEGVIIERHFGLFDNILVGYDELLAQCIAMMFKMQAYKRSPVNQINKN